MSLSLHFTDGIQSTAAAEHHDEKLFRQFVVSPVDSAGCSLSSGACSWKTFLSPGLKISLRNTLISQNTRHLSNIQEVSGEWIMVPSANSRGFLFVFFLENKIRQDKFGCVVLDDNSCTKVIFKILSVLIHPSIYYTLSPALGVWWSLSWLSQGKGRLHPGQVEGGFICHKNKPLRDSE